MKCTKVPGTLTRMKLEAETEKCRMEKRQRETDHQHELQQWKMMMQMVNPNVATGITHTHLLSHLSIAKLLFA